MTTPPNMPSPDIVFGTLFAYQGTAALRSAIDIELFTAIDEGSRTVSALASRCRASAQVSDRYRTVPGDAFKVGLGDGYDLVLMANFLHHFDQPTCTTFLRRVHQARRVCVLEFVLNSDRVSPSFPARFALTMLAETPGGDAYTLEELRTQLEDAGFKNVSSYGLPTPQTVVLAEK